MKLTGTLEGFCFYQMEGTYYVRRKSSLTGKRFRTDKAFAGSRRSAGELQRASPLASRLYHRLPKGKKGRDVFRGLTGQVKGLLREGWTAVQVEHWFGQTYLPACTAAMERRPVEKKKAVRLPVAERQSTRLPAFLILPGALVVWADNRCRQPRSRWRRRVRDRGSPIAKEQRERDSNRKPVSFCLWSASCPLRSCSFP
jgi:hypothetical protein